MRPTVTNIVLTSLLSLLVSAKSLGSVEAAQPQPLRGDNTEENTVLAPFITATSGCSLDDHRVHVITTDFVTATTPTDPLQAALEIANIHARTFIGPFKDDMRSAFLGVKSEVAEQRRDDAVTYHHENRLTGLRAVLAARVGPSATVENLGHSIVADDIIDPQCVEERHALQIES